MPKPAPTWYCTRNSSDYNAEQRQPGSLSIWFDRDTVWNVGKAGKQGRPKSFSDTAVQVCRTLKVLMVFRFDRGRAGREPGPYDRARLGRAGLFDTAAKPGADRGAGRVAVRASP